MSRLRDVGSNRRFLCAVTWAAAIAIVALGASIQGAAYAAALPTVSVDSMGAVPDGKTDCRAAIQAAFAKVRAAGGGTVQFTSGGTYLISDTIGSTSVDDRMSNVTVDGNGATIVCELSGQPRPALHLMGDHLVVENLTVTFSKKINPLVDQRVEGGDAINVGGTWKKPAQDIKVLKCHVLEAWFAGIRPVWSSNVVIADNTLDDCLATSIFPGEIRSNIQILRNTITNSKDDSIYALSGRYASATIGVTIQGNIISNGSAKGIGVGGCHNVLISSNKIDNTFGPGIQCEVTGYSPDKTRSVRIVGNTIRNAGHNYGKGKVHPAESPVPEGIYIAASNPNDFADMHILNNTIIDPGKDGIAIAHTVGAEIANNTISGCGGMGIVVGAAHGTVPQITDFSIAGNSVTDTQHTGIMVVHAGHGVVVENTVTDYGQLGGANDRGVFIYQSDGVLTAANMVTNDRGAGAPLLVAGSTRVQAVDVGANVALATQPPDPGSGLPGDVVFNTAPQPDGPLAWRYVGNGASGVWQQIVLPSP